MLIIKNARVINFYPSSVSKPADVAVKDGMIYDIGEKLEERYKAVEILELNGKYLSPGLVCSHNHFYSALARGITAEIKPSKDFIGILKNLWWKLDRALDEESLYYSGLTAALDAIKSGTTSVIDHNASPSFIKGSLDVLKEAFGKAGLRGILCYEITDRNGEKGAVQGLEETYRFIRSVDEEKISADSEHRLEAAVGAHAPFTLTDKSLSRIHDIISDTGRGIHIHVSEDKYDLSYSVDNFGTEALKRLDKFKLLNKNSIIAHGTNLTDAEISLLNERDAFLIHNSRSNMNNGVGYMNRLGKVNNKALGTDGIGSDMFEEIKAAYFKSKDAAAGLEAGDILNMLHSGNTILERYFGRRFGKIKKGYAADLAVLDYESPTPLTAENIAGHMIFGLSSRDVETVIINGKIVYRERRFGFDTEQIYERARQEAKKLWRRMDKEKA